MARLGWFPELNDERILLDTVKLEVLSDFQILYWKRLPLVYRAKFSTERADPRWSGIEPNRPGKTSEQEWFQDWWHNANSWYKLPWELPGWPPE